MKQLNQSASQLATEFSIRGGTDITGYSLLGHGMEMAQASGVSLKLNFAEIPFI
jgi:selenide,water dikinase